MSEERPAGEDEKPSLERRKLLQGPVGWKHREVINRADVKARERPKFDPARPDNENTAYVHIPINKRTPQWAGYLKREGFVYSPMRRCWAYCQHDDGTWATFEECEWVANRVREMVTGELRVTVYPGIFVEPNRKPPEDPLGEW